MNTDAQIVVGYDGSPDSLAALSWAATLASLRGEVMLVTTIIDSRQNPRGIAWPESYWADTEEKARKVLAEWPDVTTRFERHTGHLVPMLVELARDSSLLVLGSHGHNLVTEILRGSVSQSAARHAAVPVVVVRPALHPESGRIVVGADGSESSAHALDFACELAKATGDKVFALRAWHPTPVVYDRFAYTPATTGFTMDHAESELDATIARLRIAHPAVPIAGEVIYGEAERALADASDGASMVVVGSRGHTAIGEAFLGSVSAGVLHRAHCPVAVIH